MGFYGNISGSNKSAFTFDRVYNTRLDMDTLCGQDGVFLGRYVLVEYENAPINIWPDIQRHLYFLDLSRTDPVDGLVISDLGSTEIYHLQETDWNGNSPGYYKHVSGENLTATNEVSPYNLRYQVDINKYGRGYDGTVWRKAWDATKTAYRYVMLAELNAAIPTFHMRVIPPSEALITPSFDTQDSTNLNYYLQVQGQFANYFQVSTSPTDTTLAQYIPSWTYNTNEGEKVNYDTQQHPVNINYNKAGFNAGTRSYKSGDNVITRVATSSGRRYHQDAVGHYSTANDRYEWSINFPAIGNAICDVYDKIYGYSGSTRKTENYIKTSLTDNKIYGYDTLVGSLNEMRDILGYNVKFQSAAPTAVTTNTEDNNLYLIGSGATVNSIYYYAKEPIFVKDTSGQFYADTSSGTTVYRMANASTNVIPSNQRYKISDTYTYRRTALEAPINGLYGTLVYLHRILGTNVNNAREEDTVAGMIGRINDVLRNVSTSLEANRLVVTDANGVINTSATSFPITTANQNSQVLTANGNWGSRFASISVTNNTADTSAATISTSNGAVTSIISNTSTYNNRVNFLSNNKWIEFTYNNSDSAKSITISHALNGINYSNTSATMPVHAVSSSTIKIGPWRQSTSDWTSGTANTTDNLAASQLNIPAYTFDAAGHMVAYSNYAYYLPHSFKTVTSQTISNSASLSNEVTTNTTSIVADKATDTLNITTGNIWLDISNDATNDRITFGHHLNGVASTLYATDIATSRLSYNDNVMEIGPWIRTSLTDGTSDWKDGSIGTDSLAKSQLNIPSYTFDRAGHMTGWETKSFYLPHSFKFVKYEVTTGATSNSGSTASTGGTITADNAVDTLTINTANQWINIAADTSNDKLTFGHCLNALTCYAANADNKPWLSYNSTNHAIEIGPWVQDTSDWTIGSTTNAEHLSASQINIPSYTFDAAGHMIGYTNYEFYLPHSFKSISITNSTATSNSTTQATTIVADTATDSFTFGTSNKWLTLYADATNDSIDIGHIHSGVTAGSYGLSSSKSIAQLDTDNSFDVPYFSVDEAGHITSAITHNVIVPENFTTIQVNTASTTATTVPSVASSSVSATGLTDTITLNVGNKWLAIETNVNDKTFTFYHTTHTFSTAAPTSDLNNTNSLFTTQIVSWDDAGHITGDSICTFTLPYNWKNLAVTNSTTANSVTPVENTISAANCIDTMQLTSENKWIVFNADINNSNKILHVGHMLSTAGAHTESTTATTTFNTSFTIPNFIIDEAGHITSVSNTTIQLPAPTLGTMTNDIASGNIITHVTQSTATGSVSIERNYLGSVTLGTYNTSTINTVSSLGNSTKLNEAIKYLDDKIDKEIIDRSDADDEILDLIGTLPDPTNAATVVATIAAGDAEMLSSAAGYTDDEVDAVKDLIGTIAEGETVASTIAAVDNKFDDYTSTDDLDDYLSDNDFINQTAIESLINTAVSAAITNLISNYDVSLIIDEISINLDNTTISTGIQQRAGDYVAQLQKDFDNTWAALDGQDVEFGENDIESGNYVTSWDNLAAGKYRVKITRSYEGNSATGYSNDVTIE